MRYKMFTTPWCKACPAVKAHMETVAMEGEKIDASTPEGRAEAQKYGIMSVPTVLFLENGEVRATAQSVKQVEDVLK